MNKKNIIIGSVLIVLALVMLMRGLAGNSKDVVVQEESVVFPKTDGTDIKKNVITAWDGNNEEGVVKISLENGGMIRARDFLQDEDTFELSDDGIYSFSSSQKQGKIGDSYNIYYDDLDGSIIVSLRSVPLSTSRFLAEISLKQDTGLSEDDLCTANILVNTPLEVSPGYSGRNLGLSFCPGSVSLE